MKLARYYSDHHGADELLVFDLSDSDEDHDNSIDLMRKINRNISIPMVAGGNIKRLEDVKKILYAGAKRAMLNFSKPGSAAEVEEAAKRFGKKKTQYHSMILTLCLNINRSLRILQVKSSSCIVWTLIP